MAYKGDPTSGVDLVVCSISADSCTVADTDITRQWQNVVIRPGESLF